MKWWWPLMSWRQMKRKGIVGFFSGFWPTQINQAFKSFIKYKLKGVLRILRFFKDSKMASGINFIVCRCLLAIWLFALHRIHSFIKIGMHKPLLNGKSLAEGPWKLQTILSLISLSGLESDPLPLSLPFSVLVIAVVLSQNGIHSMLRIRWELSSMEIKLTAWSKEVPLQRSQWFTNSNTLFIHLCRYY